MNVTREELQEAGASPELARILADRLSRHASGDLTRNPMVVSLSGIALAAFLGALGWLVLTTTSTQTDVALLKVGQIALEERMTSLEGRIIRIEEKVDGLEGRMIRIEDKLDRLLQE